MLRNLLLACSLLTCLSTGANAAPNSWQAFFDETFGNFQEELDQARADQKKGILIFFQQADCPFCHRMETTVLNRPEVQDYYRKYFRTFSVDIQGDLEVTDFQGHTTTQKDFAFKQYKVRATPVFAFFDLDGRLIARHTGPTRDAQEFLWLGEYVTDDHYLTESFARFKRTRQQQVRAE